MIGKSKIALLGAALGAAAMLRRPRPGERFRFLRQADQIAIGFGFGGTYGKYSRMFAEHLKKHIPGNPNIIVTRAPAPVACCTNLCCQGTARQWP